MGFEFKWLYRFGALALLAAAVWSSARPAQATGMRCENKLVSTGDTTYEVRSLCGPPDDLQQRTEVRSVKRIATVPCATGQCSVVVEDAVQINVEEWLYDFGPQRFIQHLTFEQGKLVNLRSGAYGRKQN